MSWESDVKKNLDIVVPKGKGDTHELRLLFDLYNERRAEITGDQHASRETATHCSGCVERVLTRLKNYIKYVA